MFHLFAVFPLYVVRAMIYCIEPYNSSSGAFIHLTPTRSGCCSQELLMYLTLLKFNDFV